MIAKNILYTIALFCIFGLSPVGALAAGIGASPGSSYDATAIHKKGPQRMNGPLNIMHGGAGSAVTEGLAVNLSTDRYLTFDLNGLFVCGVDGCLSIDGNDGTLTVPFVMNTTGMYDSTISTSPLYLRASNSDSSGTPAIVVTTANAFTTAGRKLLSIQNNSVEKAAIDKDGGLQIGVGNTAAAPTCDSNSRGKFWYQGGGAGVKDNVQVCAKDAANAYAWRTIY